MIDTMISSSALILAIVLLRLILKLSLIHI